MQREGTPDECTRLVLFLAGDEASYITGAEIAIDGGYTAGGPVAALEAARHDCRREDHLRPESAPLAQA